MQIVTAGILEKNGKIFIAKRKKGKCLKDKWEFPGGKLENGETPEECLKRELFEELNIQIKVEKYFCSSFFKCGEVEIELQAYLVSYLSGEIKIVDHDDFKWIKPSEMLDFEFVEPDIVIVNKLLQEKYNIQKTY